MEPSVSGKGSNQAGDLENENKSEAGYNIMGRCVQKYPQAIADPDHPRLAYWTCNSKVQDWCITTFNGCGRNLCDLHCKKFTDFRMGQKRHGVVTREYLVEYYCHDCLPKV